MFVKSLRQAIPQSKIGDFCQPPRHRWPWGGGIEGPSGRPVPTRKTGCGAFDPAAMVIVTWRAIRESPLRRGRRLRGGGETLWEM